MLIKKFKKKLQHDVKVSRRNAIYEFDEMKVADKALNVSRFGS